KNWPRMSNERRVVEESCARTHVGRPHAFGVRGLHGCTRKPGVWSCATCKRVSAGVCGASIPAQGEMRRGPPSTVHIYVL
ncbi:hypothetical protein HAX54_026959, partial [Datura stramonium]|nr:hypothetical protein [Datura stramonium]